MSNKLLRSGVLGTLAVLILGLLPVLPASAAPLRGTSLITSAKDLFAGRQHEVTFRINNPSTATIGSVGETQPAMNFVRIIPASGFTLSCPTTPPANWGCRVTNNGFADFSDANGATAGGTIAPGANMSFTVLASAPRPGGDQTRPWQTQMSHNDGDEFVTNDSTPGALETTVRILQVTNVSIGAPVGAVDHTVTSGQNNTFVDVTVINAGTAAKEATATLTSPSGSDSVRGTPPGPQTVPAYNGATDGSSTFRFGYNFGSVGTRKLTGDATAPGANAVDGQSSDIVVQTPTDLTYMVGSLNPLASRSGVSTTFQVGINKSGDPSVSGLAGSLTFRRSDGTKSFTANLTSPSSYPAGSSSVAHSFGPVVIPGTAEAASKDLADPDNYDGDYDISFNVTGTDGNDASVNVTKSLTDVFTIDNLIPGVVPTISSPNRLGETGKTRAAQNADATKAFVIKNGQTLTFGGQIFKAGQSGTLDTTAQVVACELRVYNDSGQQVQNIPVGRASCRENGLGGIQGSHSVADFGPGLKSGTVLLHVEVADKVSTNVGTGDSNRALIDNIVPLFDTGTTGCAGLTAANCAGGETRTIQLPTTEPITGTYAAVEFRCETNVVTNAAFNGNETTYGDRVILTLGTPVDEDGVPDCTYERPGVRPAPQDSPTNNFINLQDLVILDNIAPDLPTILKVNGTDPYSDDGQFYTNDSTPEVQLGGVKVGYTGIVARETNGTDGYQFGLDDELCRFAAGGDNKCSTADLGADSPRAVNPDGSLGDHQGYTLYGAAIDARGNVSIDKDGLQVGNGTPFKVVLDRVAPQASTALADATKVTVTFNEKLNGGRNSAQDWAVRVLTTDGELVFAGVDTVTDDGFTKKVLNMAQNSVWTGSIVREVRYGVETNQARRHQDRAGNLLTDFPPGPQPKL